MHTQYILCKKAVVNRGGWMVVAEKVKPKLPEGAIKKTNLERSAKILDNFYVNCNGRKITTPQELEEVQGSVKTGNVTRLINKKTGTLSTLLSPDFQVECFKVGVTPKAKGKEAWQYGIEWKTADVNQSAWTGIDLYESKDDLWASGPYQQKEGAFQTISAKRNAQNVYGEQGNYEYACGPFEDGAGGGVSGQFKKYRDAAKLVVKTYYIENMPPVNSIDAWVKDKELIGQQLNSQFGVPAGTPVYITQIGSAFSDDRTKFLVAYGSYYDSTETLLKNLGAVVGFEWKDSDTDPDNPKIYQYLYATMGWPTKAYNDTISPDTSHVVYSGNTFGCADIPDGYIPFVRLPCFKGIEKEGPGAVEEGKVVLRRGVTVTPTLAKGSVSFEYKGSLDRNAKLEIHDVVGRLVKTAQFGGSQKMTMDVSSMKEGVYFAKVTVEGKENSVKFTVIR